VKLLRTIRLDALDTFVFDTQQLVFRCGQQQIHRRLKPQNLVAGLPIRQVEAVN
jgi:hypothetical protein